MRSHFTVLRKDRELLRVTVNQPGLHNVLNAWLQLVLRQMKARIRCSYLPRTGRL